MSIDFILGGEETNRITCSECGIEKDRNDFYKKKRGTLMGVCISCNRKLKKSGELPPDPMWSTKHYHNIKSRAKKKGLEFTLTLDQFDEIKRIGVCAYCDMPTNVITFDRLDNSKGYIMENIVPSCYFCNRLKNDMPFNLEEMRHVGKAVRLYFKRNPDASRISKKEDSHQFKYLEDQEEIIDILGI